MRSASGILILTPPLPRARQERVREARHDGAAARGVIELFQPEREVDSMSTEMTRAHVVCFLYELVMMRDPQKAHPRRALDR